jgi:tRNA nucleotidyltransferase (CCA-adding enzyme)
MNRREKFAAQWDSFQAERKVIFNNSQPLDAQLFWDCIASDRPGTALFNAVDDGRITFWTIAQLQVVPQDDQWHPEGNVDIHTMHVMDEMSAICKRDGIIGRGRDLYVIAALEHDTGKPGCTDTKVIDGLIRWVSPGHDNYVTPAKALLDEIGIVGDEARWIVGMVKLHMYHINFKNNTPSKKAIRKFRNKLQQRGMTVYDFDRMVEADISGRPPHPKHKSEVVQVIIEMVENYVEPVIRTGIVTGKMLIAMGYQPGGEFHGMIKSAASQEGTAFTDVAGARAWVASEYPQ